MFKNSMMQPLVGYLTNHQGGKIEKKVNTYSQRKEMQES